MVTFAQAQERADEWVNGDVAVYQHREVRVREFELGFVVWAEDRAEGPVSDGGCQRLVIARDSGEATLWPGLPVGEVIRRYEEEYGAPSDAPPAPAPPQRIDLNQTSFLLTPPEWLQEAADKLGIPDRRADRDSGARPDADASAGAGATPVPGTPVASAAPSVPSSPSPSSPSSAPSPAAPAAPVGAPSGDSADDWPAAAGQGAPGDYEPTASDGVPASASSAAVPVGSTPWAGTDTNGGSDEGAVPLPATVFAPPLSGADDEGAPPPVVPADAPTALMSGGSHLPRTSVAPALNPQQGPGPGPADIADAATSKAVVQPRGTRGGGAGTPPPPGAPGTPGMRPGATPPPSGPGAPGAPAGGYLPTQLVAQQGPPGAPQPPGPPGPPGAPTPPGPPAPPGPPGATPPPGGGMHHAATMFADPSSPGGPAAPQPPGPPGVPGAGAPQPPGPPGPPGAPGAPGAPQPPGPPGPPTPPAPPGGGGVHHAATMLASPGPVGPQAPQPPGPPGPPGMPLGGAPGPVPPNPHAPPPPPPSYGYPQQPTGQPTVGPGYQAVLRFRAPDGSEQQLIRRSAPGTPHPEWQMLHELRAMNVPPQQVIELHTELESCELPGGYCARMIRETWPQVRITSVAPYGTDHASRQQGMQHLLTHQGELHQVADGPARPAPVRAPLPQLPPAPAIPPEGVAEELVMAFGPQGVLRFDQRAVSRQGVPEIVARTLVWAGLPADFGPFFWAQPGQPVVPTLAELATQRQVQPASDAGSYLVMGTDFGRAICVQYGTANIVAVPVEAGPDGRPTAPQFVNTGLPEFVRSMALLGRMWRLRFGLNPEQAGRWTVDFQAQLVALDPAALASPESWWSVLLEQMWDGLL
ncbi:SUKH-4 family immunity protein [Streptomyces sp. NBC_01237]|uniref:SUKH-4 family immunity protein n=1 Tax=Streptomyces sp. NBC_01237 TaxID=2903790 RepID=UPI002DDB1C6E|nr:SUKH-4 family immunity protein [Streptomyces sp. NBC_01237]WRZ72959.1 SUKH-4 family immunity protein [Streptomyces sp. NBC_01237]